MVILLLDMHAGISYEEPALARRRQAHSDVHFSFTLCNYSLNALRPHKILDTFNSFHLLYLFGGIPTDPSCLQTVFVCLLFMVCMRTVLRDADDC